MPASRIQQRTDGEVKGLSRGYGGVLLVLNLIITGVFWWQLPPEIPLFYSLPYGLPQLAQRGWFLLLPGLAILIFGICQLLMKWPIKSTLYVPMMGWLQTLSLFFIMLAMAHIIIVVL